jgi:hypothetical protein
MQDVAHRRWPKVTRSSHRTAAAKSPRKGKPTHDRVPTEGYWQEWTPEDPLANNFYCTELYLPPGLYLLNASASLRLGGDAPGPSEVECSLFVGEENRFLTQLTLSPGEAEAMAATGHVDSLGITRVEWSCGGTAAPFRLQLAVTAIRVDRLHYVGTPPL